MASRVLFGAACGVMIVQVPEVLRGRLSLDWFYFLPLSCVCLFLLVMAFSVRGLASGATATVSAVALGVAFVLLVVPGLGFGHWPDLAVAVLGMLGAVAIGVQWLVQRGKEHRAIAVSFALGSVAAGLLLLQVGVMRYASHFQTMGPSIGDLMLWAWQMSVILLVASGLAAPAALKGIGAGRRTRR